MWTDEHHVMEGQDRQESYGQDGQEYGEQMDNI